MRDPATPPVLLSRRGGTIFQSTQYGVPRELTLQQLGIRPPGGEWRQGRSFLEIPVCFLIKANWIDFTSEIMWNHVNPHVFWWNPNCWYIYIYSGNEIVKFGSGKSTPSLVLWSTRDIVNHWFFACSRKRWVFTMCLATNRQNISICVYIICFWVLNQFEISQT